MYKTVWTLYIWQSLKAVLCRWRQTQWPHCVRKANGAVAGYAPWEMSCTFWHFLRHKRWIECEITGTRKHGNRETTKRGRGLVTLANFLVRAESAYYVTIMCLMWSRGSQLLLMMALQSRWTDLAMVQLQVNPVGKKWYILASVTTL